MQSGRSSTSFTIRRIWSASSDTWPNIHSSTKSLTSSSGYGLQPSSWYSLSKNGPTPSVASGFKRPHACARLLSAVFRAASNADSLSTMNFTGVRLLRKSSSGRAGRRFSSTTDATMAASIRRTSSFSISSAPPSNLLHATLSRPLLPSRFPLLCTPPRSLHI